MNYGLYLSATGVQSSLYRQDVLANNLANVQTTGFKPDTVMTRERLPERIEANLAVEPQWMLEQLGGGHFVEPTRTSLGQSSLEQTHNPLDLAIEGEGFFQVETPEGNRLTRAGAFTPSPEGELVTPDGYRLLDLGGAPVFVPTDAGPVAVAQDGTVSAGGNPVAQVGLFLPADPNGLVHAGGTRFAAEGGIEPFEGGAIFQGFLENSNVDPISEIARMIEVQRAYEMGQGFLDTEDRRIRSVIETLGRT